jgi:SpoVK/Ycf46/Vps4 family AAA+-type ATPase
VRRLYVPLPDPLTRCQLLSHLLKKNENIISEVDIQELGKLTDGYSGADVTNLAREASMGPLREVLRNSAPPNNNSGTRSLRPINRRDFEVALKSVKASVSNMDLAMYEKWNNEFGTQQFVE